VKEYSLPQIPFSFFHFLANTRDWHITPDVIISPSKKKYIYMVQPGVVAHACNSSIRKQRQEDHDFETAL
jgi:hypothetical protein